MHQPSLAIHATPPDPPKTPPPAPSQGADAARRRKRELRVAGHAIGDALFAATTGSDRIIETIERGFAELAARFDRFEAAIAERAAPPAAVSAAPAPVQTLPEILDKLDLAKLQKVSVRTLGRQIAFGEVPPPERIEPSPERKKELAKAREQQRLLNGDAPKAKPKGRGLGKAVWRREVIEQWLAEGRPPAKFFKPKDRRP